MKFLKKILKWLGILTGVLLLLLLVFSIYVYNISDIEAPEILDRSALEQQRIIRDSAHFELGKNYLQKNAFGVYEMYLEGSDFERGVAFGKLASELIRFQELAFTNEIQRMVPSKKYLRFLKYIVGFMNRDLDKYVPAEYQREIYGISMSASEEFNWIGTNYSRQLNYHAAHDIGHALANMMLVGCTSFATWNQFSEDSLLTVGRNFDFYVGDDFAKNKIIAFYRPDKGIPFMSVTWAGFAGVVSGMNLKGLTVTINANKSSIPGGAATPVSLVAREILQYASTIDEAKAIASKRKMFVSESFLVSSAADHKAIVIEKTPDEIDFYDPGNGKVLCSNHYQGQKLSKEKLNIEQLEGSASSYRYQRLQQLLDASPGNNPVRTAAILRDRFGLNNSDIGLTNEKALNQFIAHHSVIFQPEKLLAWVSTSPWQSGTYVCYDLGRIFSDSRIVQDSNRNIAADTFLAGNEYINLREYLVLEQLHLHGSTIAPMAPVRVNPNYYDSYRIAGDIYSAGKQADSAILMYRHALTLEIATTQERKAIEKKLSKLLNP